MKIDLLQSLIRRVKALARFFNNQLNMPAKQLNSPYILIVFLCLLFGALLSSCNEKDRMNPDVSDVQVEFKVRRLDRELRDCESKEDIKRLLDKDKAFSEFFFNRSNYPHDSVLINNIYQFVTYEFTDTLFMDAERVYGDFKQLEDDFREAFKHVKYYYPNFQVPDIYLMVSGFGAFGWGGADMELNDKYLVIGLDFYGGEESTYRPPAKLVPDYMLRRLNKEHLVTNVMLKMSNYFNKTTPPKASELNYDNSMLAEMIFFGKAYAFVNYMVPSADDSIIIGYRGEDLITVHNNQVGVYGHFIENKLFYETSDVLKNKYIREAPRVVDIADECPGRIGQWLGWQIVKHYLHENSDLTLQELMDTWDAKEIFQKSKYKPRASKS